MINRKGKEVKQVVVQAELKDYSRVKYLLDTLQTEKATDKNGDSYLFPNLAGELMMKGLDIKLKEFNLTK